MEPPEIVMMNVSTTSTYKIGRFLFDNIQSLKLTAEAGVQTRSAQENEFVVAARRKWKSKFG
jgi:hypothetical protein